MGQAKGTRNSCPSSSYILSVYSRYRWSWMYGHEEMCLRHYMVSSNVISALSTSLHTLRNSSAHGPQFIILLSTLHVFKPRVLVFNSISKFKNWFQVLEFKLSWGKTSYSGLKAQAMTIARKFDQIYSSRTKKKSDLFDLYM